MTNNICSVCLQERRLIFSCLDCNAKLCKKCINLNSMRCKDCVTKNYAEKYYNTKENHSDKGMMTALIIILLSAFLLLTPSVFGAPNYSYICEDYAFWDSGDTPINCTTGSVTHLDNMIAPWSNTGECQYLDNVAFNGTLGFGSLGTGAFDDYSTLTLDDEEDMTCEIQRWVNHTSTNDGGIIEVRDGGNRIIGIWDRGAGLGCSDTNWCVSVDNGAIVDTGVAFSNNAWNYLHFYWAENNISVYAGDVLLAQDLVTTIHEADDIRVWHSYNGIRTFYDEFRCWSGHYSDRPLNAAAGNAPPLYSNNYTYPASPQNYTIQDYYFNATWTDSTLSIVTFEFGGLNYTPLNISDQYYKSFSNLAVGSYDFRYYANDTLGATNMTEMATYIVSGHVPLYSNNKTYPASPQNFTLQDYYFNVTWQDGDIQAVIFEFGGVNYTTQNVTDQYYKMLSDITAGSYQYRFYANDSVGGSNQTEYLTYIITSIPPNATNISGNPYNTSIIAKTMWFNTDDLDTSSTEGVLFMFFVLAIMVSLTIFAIIIDVPAITILSGILLFFYGLLLFTTTSVLIGIIIVIISIIYVIAMMLK